MSQVDILPEPSHRIGWGLAALVVAGNMIGSGVYLLPATLAPTGSSSVIGWIVCGIGAVTLALVFGGLGRMQPEADGLSDFARRGLGRFLGYQTGLAYWAACLTGNVAVAVAGTGYLAFFFPALKEPMWGALSNLALIWLTTATDVGRASLGGVLLAFVVYVAASVAVFGVIPADVLAHSTSPYADLVARVMGASVAGLVAACAVIKATGTIAGWTMMGGETARASAEAGWLPRWFGGAQKGRTPLSNPLINGVIMSAMVIASAQPTLGQQFGVLIGVTSVLTLCLYALCSVTLWKLTKTPGWRLLAVGGAVFSAFAVAAAAGGYIWPSVGFFAVTSLAWLWVRKSQGRFQNT